MNKDVRRLSRGFCVDFSEFEWELWFSMRLEKWVGIILRIDLLIIGKVFGLYVRCDGSCLRVLGGECY